MASTRLALAALGLLVVALASTGQAPPAAVPRAGWVGVVGTEAATLMSGPGDRFPPTGSVGPGTQLTVVREVDGGWLEVEPPKGQVSWIRALHVDDPERPDNGQVPRMAPVSAEPDAAVAVGRPGDARPLDVQHLKLRDGSVVKVVSESVMVDGGNGVNRWVRIEPPAGDYRYVRASLVGRTPGAVAGFSVTSPSTPSAPGPSPFVPPASGVVPASSQTPILAAPLSPAPAVAPAVAGKPEGWPSHPTWLAAQAAERAGDNAKAERLYRELAAELHKANGDEELIKLCFGRLHAVREKRPAATPAAAEPAPAKETPRERPAGERWADPGKLRETTLKTDGKPTYAVSKADGKLQCYVVAGSGVDLAAFVGHRVDLYGAMSYPAHLDGVGLLTVTRAQDAPGKGQ